MKKIELRNTGHFKKTAWQSTSRFFYAFVIFRRLHPLWDISLYGTYRCPAYRRMVSANRLSAMDVVPGKADRSLPQSFPALDPPYRRTVGLKSYAGFLRVDRNGKITASLGYLELCCAGLLN